MATSHGGDWLLPVFSLVVGRLVVLTGPGGAAIVVTVASGSVPTTLVAVCILGGYRQAGTKRTGLFLASRRSTSRYTSGAGPRGV